MTERIMTDSNGRKYITTEPFKPDWDAMAVMVEEQQRMAQRICELEAQRTWVGLTEEELYEIYDESDDGSSPCGVCGACSKCKIEVAIARAIEAKLKEKNT